MNAIKEIKKEMLLTQQNIADYLGVSRSFIAAVESGRKELSTSNLIKLTKLFIQFNKKSTDKVEQEIAEEELMLNKFLEQKNMYNQFIKLRLEKQLKTMQSKYINALQLIQTSRILQNNANKKDVLCLQIMEFSAKEILRKNNLVKQKRLEIKLLNL